MFSSMDTVMSDEEPPTDFLFLLFLLSWEAILLDGWPKRLPAV